MADLYNLSETKALLKNKVVVLFGDSNTRALYKDIVWLLNQNTLIHINSLTKKLPKTIMGDKLVRSSVLSKSRDYFEERCFKTKDHYVTFNFVTKCYCDSVIDYMKDLKDGRCTTPDIVIMNSCLWDITRWGPNGVEEFKVNMVKLMNLLEKSLPTRTLFIWTTTLPISTKSIKGGLIIKQIEFMERSLRFHILEANLFSKNLVKSYGYDVIDFHYHLQYQISRRANDGVHFLPLPVRLLTNLCLTHIALSWGRPLPGKGDFMMIDDEIDLACKSSCLTNDNNKTKTFLPQPSGSSNLMLNNQVQRFRVTFPSGNVRLNRESLEAFGCVIRGEQRPLPLLPPPAQSPQLHLNQRRVETFFEDQDLRNNNQVNSLPVPNQQNDGQGSFKPTQTNNTPKNRRNRRRSRRSKKALKRLQHRNDNPVVKEGHSIVFGCMRFKINN